MSSIILKLQEDIINSNMSLSDLLRKSLLIARKLEIEEFEEWVSNELNGYEGQDKVPEYRIIKGHLQADNGFRIVPVILNSENEEQIGKQQIFLSVAELESFIGQRSVYLQLPSEAQRALAACFHGGEYCTFTKVFSPSQIVVILDKIKTTLLNFTIGLEKQGILGDGVMFSADEKEKAKMIVTNNYINAPVQNLQMQQGTENSSQKMNLVGNEDIKESLEKILNEIENLGLNQNDKNDLYAEIQTIKFQMQSSKPKERILCESWHTARNILEGVAAGLLSSGIAPHVEKISQVIKSIT